MKNIGLSKHLLFAGLIGLIFIGLCQAAATNRTSGSTVGPVSPYDHCTVYCDRHGRWYDIQPCKSEEPYCCGSRFDRFCCDDVSLRNPHNLPMEWCPFSRQWWQMQWRVIVGMLVSLLVMLVSVACCYYCCTNDRALGSSSYHRRRSRHRVESEETSTSTSSADAELSRRPSRGFDPRSPCAFQPPAYETLPKEPPKYSDIFIVGQSNAAFVGEPEEGMRSRTEAAQPPTYSSAVDAGRDVETAEVSMARSTRQSSALGSHSQTTSGVSATDGAVETTQVSVARSTRQASSSDSNRASTSSVSANNTPASTSSSKSDAGHFHSCSSDANTTHVPSSQTHQETASPRSSGITVVTRPQRDNMLAPVHT